MELLSVTMNDGVMPRSEIEGKDNSSEDKSNYKVVCKGDMVYNSMRMWQGANGVSDYDGIVSPAYTVLMPTEEIDNCYFATLFKTPNLINEFRKNSQGLTSDTWNLKYPQIRPIRLYIPSLQEQHKISAFIGELEERIGKQRQLVDSLKKYKRGLLSAIFDRRIRFKADDGSEFPNWMSVTLQDVAEAFEYGMNAAATDFDGKHKYIRITDIDDSSHRYIDNNPVSPSGDISAKYKVAEDDILFARTGASVGKSYLYDTDDGDLYFAGFLIRAHVRPEYNSYFVYINTLSYNYAKWVALESMRSGQPGINAEQYKEYSFPCPSLDEQRKIARFVMRIDKKIRTEEMKLEKFHSCKTGLLQQLFI